MMVASILSPSLQASMAAQSDDCNVFGKRVARDKTGECKIDQNTIFQYGHALLTTRKVAGKE